MTSSLVGSEMCIRDSSYSRTQGRVRLNGLSAAVEEGLNIMCLAPNGHDFCLLYTSDAADDM
eukprot:9436779-Prorocentrum_lima.AAC.1